MGLVVVLSWRGKYIGWFRLMSEKLDGLLPELSDVEVMESVTSDDVFYSPTIEDDKPRNQRKPIPQISLALTDDSINVSVTFSNRESIDHLKNLFHDGHKRQEENLFEALGSLDSYYESMLYTRNRDDSKPRLVRKYVASRLDRALLERMIEESEQLRKGGRSEQFDSSVYVQPENPELVLASKKVGLDEGEFMLVLDQIRPIYDVLRRVKTRRELISSRLSTTRRKKNQYREFIELLNEARKLALISAEQRRGYNDKWRRDEDSRDSLIEELNELLRR